MGKFNLGESNTYVNEIIKKNGLFVDEAKCAPIVNGLVKDLDSMRDSLIKIQHLLNKCVTSGLVKNSKADTFKGWAKKAKSQSSSCEKIKSLLISKYNDDLEKYPIKLLDDRIRELEEKIKEMEK